jgi:hypothetical protein
VTLQLLQLLWCAGFETVVVAAVYESSELFIEFGFFSLFERDVVAAGHGMLDGTLRLLLPRPARRQAYEAQP